MNNKIESEFFCIETINENFCKNKLFPYKIIAKDYDGRKYTFDRDKEVMSFSRAELVELHSLLEDFLFYPGRIINDK